MDKTNRNKVLELIFDKPTYKFHIREIARITNIHPNTAISMLKELKGEKIVNVEKKKHLVEVYGNLMSKEFIQRKRAHNLLKIYSCGLVDFINEKISPESISVIGSYSIGEDIERSDIDIVVISGKEGKNINLDKFESFLKRRIHLLFVDYNSISNEFYTNLINGIVLSGAIRRK